MCVDLIGNLSCVKYVSVNSPRKCTRPIQLLQHMCALAQGTDDDLIEIKTRPIQAMYC